jgi:hypothetical protein
MYASRVPIPSIDFSLDTHILYDSLGRVQYVCLADPGTLTSKSKWQIFKLSYSGTSTKISKKRYANKTDTFDKIADLYATYNYTDI